MAWPRGGCKDHAKSSRGCLVEAPAELLGHYARGSRGRDDGEYITSSQGREVFEQAYDEALSVALASGARPERMIVEPIPPARSGRSVPSEEYDAWLDQILERLR